MGSFFKKGVELPRAVAYSNQTVERNIQLGGRNQLGWIPGPDFGALDELSQSKHMELTIYTKGNVNLASYGQDHADVGAEGERPVGGLNDPFGGLVHPDTFLTSLEP
ncbi:hypothetical protein FRACYDRAFT_249020 [Fragilariopsis cylindrus CCMP1102]|uniref:Uncharacterized protein n=1 Tax=Fragilariopsis cylindrus CCMP1102 TaxID=635003 RepID=A0A1E7ETE7_9STRA|nr:hypothetical protein FRACYDRAFT_249020 [Fragilariopsis cylindrus CCMP1102]|eukprot:OEU09107.1 hypothetical protein FRACYDRAFT_249020 [Fragilariopsis cylindrus CCMP1102]